MPPRPYRLCHRAQRDRAERGRKAALPVLIHNVPRILPHRTIARQPIWDQVPLHYITLILQVTKRDHIFSQNTSEFLIILFKNLIVLL